MTSKTSVRWIRLGALVLAILSAMRQPTVFAATGGGCDAFLSQEMAQVALDADLTDPNHLDTDFDGVACEPDQAAPVAPDAPGFGTPNLNGDDGAPAVAAEAPAPAALAPELIEQVPSDAIQAIVVGTIDGDMISVKIDDPTNEAFGQTRTIRLAGVVAGADTATGEGCFAAEASRRMEIMLPAGRTVYLESIPTGSQNDRFVWFKGKTDGKPYLANEILVREGFAVVDFAADHPYQSWLTAAQPDAAARGIGLWTTCAEARRT